MDEMVKKYAKISLGESQKGKEVVPDMSPSKGLGENEEAEEVRLLRAIRSRGKSFRKTSEIFSVPSPAQIVSPPKAAEEKPRQAWKDRRQQIEEERKAKAIEFEEKKKKEDEEKRLAAEKQKQASEQIQKSLSQRQGVPHTFVCEGLIDFDAAVYICGSLTNGKEIEVPLDTKSMEFKITLPVPPGVNFYRFKVDGRWQVDKKKPTGVDPAISEVSNKVEA